MTQLSNGTSECGSETDLDYKGIDELAMDYALYITSREGYRFEAALKARDEMMRRYGPLETNEAMEQALATLRMVDP